jgi:predicted nucleotidyltransferase
VDFSKIGKVYEFLNQCGFQYFIVGGLAEGVLGEPRFTQDIDVILFIPNDRMSEFLEKAGKAGFTFNREECIINAQKRFCFRIYFDQLPFDCLLAITAFEIEALQRAITVPFKNFSIRFPSPEDFIILKLLAARDRDWADIKIVALRHKPTLNIKYIQQWMQSFSQTQKKEVYLERFKRFLREIDNA